MTMFWWYSMGERAGILLARYPREAALVLLCLLVATWCGCAAAVLRKKRQ